MLFSAKPNIEKMTAKKDLDGLFKALFYNIQEKNPKRASEFYSIRKATVHAIAELEDPVAIPNLVEYLEKEIYPLGPDTVMDIINVLSIDIEKTESFFKTLSEFSNEYFIIQFASLMGKKGSMVEINSFISILERRLKDKSESMIKAAASALSIIDSPEAIPPLVKALNNENSRHLYTYIIKCLIPYDGSAYSLLFSELDINTSRYSRDRIYEALDALGWKPTNDSEIYARCLHYKAPAEAAKLGAYGQETSERILANQSENLENREFAISVLSYYKNKAAIISLIHALEEEDLQLAAIDALCRHKSLEAVPPLMEILSKSKNIGICIQAAHALGQIGSRESMDLLQRVANNSEYVLSKTASNACEKIKADGYWAKLQGKLNDLVPVPQDVIDRVRKEHVRTENAADAKDATDLIFEQYQYSDRILSEYCSENKIYQLKFDNQKTINNLVIQPDQNLQVTVIRDANQFFICFKGEFIK